MAEQTADDIRALMKQKIAKQIGRKASNSSLKEDVKEERHASPARPSVRLFGATAFMVLLAIFGFGVLEIDFELPLLNAETSSPPVAAQFALSTVSLDNLQSGEVIQVGKQSGDLQEVMDLDTETVTGAVEGHNVLPSSNESHAGMIKLDPESVNAQLNAPQVVADTAGGHSQHVGEYPSCNATTLTSYSGVLDYVVQQLEAAPTFTQPFNYSTYFCSFWPAETYAKLVEYFPPDVMFDNYKAKQKSCGEGGCRYAMEHTTILKAKEKKKKTLWPQISEAKPFWQNISDIVFSPQFEKALWKKLDVKPSIKRRELRILSDKNGWANGRIHTDTQATKIATMMFYITNSTAAVYDYGTCLHTFAQYKNRIIQEKGVERKGVGRDGEGDCFYKFQFLPNSGYSFRVSKSSWHSAPNRFIKHHETIHRNTLLVNWY
ncbi:hypothetical protein CYMTET_51339 [Cymbomonas tetramitiformis]|uniref:Uncharacterized protein n=1 Tax=Cymbomonas tetramitiformis TaxID=36881 RepID=A0AAE0ETT3_9CHLO|nr:hypothetical protein CYMTET_51339 [Cymbomonas tetramitiformis]